jgi:hypothetical protein
VGEWKDNKKNGYGVFYYHSGAVYEGHFVDDLRQGQGKLTFMAGSSVEEGYEGTWEQDEWHGRGIYRYRKEEGERARCDARVYTSKCKRPQRLRCGNGQC